MKYAVFCLTILVLAGCNPMPPLLECQGLQPGRVYQHKVLDQQFVVLEQPFGKYVTVRGPQGMAHTLHCVELKPEHL